MIVWLNITNVQPWQDSTDPRVYGDEYSYDYADFDVDTEQVSFGSRTERLYIYDTPIENVSLGADFYRRCLPNSTTERVYSHQGLGVVTHVDDAYATACGWNGATCSLQLSVTTAGLTATAVVSGAHGTVRYSLDGGLTSQTSPVFAALQLDTDYVLTAIDDGASNCRRTYSFRLSAAPAGAVTPPVGAPTGLDLSLHPLWHQLRGLTPSDEVLLELYVETGHYQADYRRVALLRLRVDADGRVAFRLDGILHRQLTAFEPLLGANPTTQRPQGPVRNYFVRTAVVTGGAQASWTTGALRTVLRGGLPAERRDVAWYAPAQPAFLSWQPRGKTVTPQQPEWWSWLSPPGTPGVVLVRRRYLPADALLQPTLTSETVTVAPTGQSTSYRLLALPLQAAVGEGAVGVDMWLESEQGQVLSEVLHFDLEAEGPRTRYVLFTNSLGGCDTLRTSGRREASLETKEELGTRLLQPTTTPAWAARTLVTAAEPTQRFKVNTGWLTAAQWAWLQELVLARERWQADGVRLLPLLLTKASLPFARDERPLAGWSFEYEYAFPTTAYAAL